MTQVVPGAQPRNLPAARYTLGAPAGNRRPVTMWVDGTPLYGTLYEPTTAAARGQRVGVLILEQLSWHRMHHRLARHLAAAGYYALTVDFRSRGESGVSDEWEMWQRHWVPASMVADTLQAIATFRALVPLQRLVGYGYCQAGHVAARAAALGALDGLVFAGPVTIDDYFRHHYKGVLSGLPDLWASDDLNLFEPLAEFSGPVLFIHGDRDLFLAASPLDREVERAEAWQQAAPGRSFELCIVQGADHTFSAWPHESIVIEHTLAFVERHFGPGYPRAWQGPPPTSHTAPRPQAASPDDPAAWVPLLAPGARLLPTPDSGYLALPSGRQFALTPPLAAFVRLIDGHRPLATIAAQLAP
ncbi:MAG TPA: dienelactone hydrolase family protein, partial [Chloroflexota bacterium]|nr:dienelactone hydrolase family protein [Chloroflexota bacterium]